MKPSLIKIRTTLLILSFFLVTSSIAQQQRTIREPAFGVEFTAPEGWQYQKTEEGYLMGHNSIAGVIIITVNPYTTVAEMRQEAYDGIQEEGGTSLKLNGVLKPFGQNGLAGNFQGTINWEQVKAYSIGLISPVGGSGISCMIMTTPSVFENIHIVILETLASSFKFFKPEIPDVVKEWNDWFKTPGGCRLKFMSSASSSTYGYTASTSQATIDLCPNGQFSFSSSSEITMSIDAGSAYNNSNDGGAGLWKITFDGTNPVLALNFNDGRAWEYVLTYVDQKTYLDDARYFVLFNEEGPGCY
ncbi:MAG: hypothetical protein L3J29_04510 [Cyclobacteriaceae bacterium]|nr:hypothetical protein [Cyclobacteriaceae bacterium]